MKVFKIGKRLTIDNSSGIAEKLILAFFQDTDIVLNLYSHKDGILKIDIIGILDDTQQLINFTSWAKLTDYLEEAL